MFTFEYFEKVFTSEYFLRICASWVRGGEGPRRKVEFYIKKKKRKKMCRRRPGTRGHEGRWLSTCRKKKKNNFPEASEGARGNGGW